MRHMDIQQWEYRLIGFSRGRVISSGSQHPISSTNEVKSLPRNVCVIAGYLEQAGLEGWEAVGLSDHWILLKRPVG